jgi:hypothetical protein
MACQLASGVLEGDAGSGLQAACVGRPIGLDRHYVCNMLIVLPRNV